MQAMGPLKIIYANHDFHGLFYKPIFENLLRLIKDADDNVEE